jgi:hypothetical protein
MQIAYNIGQLLAELKKENSPYTSEQKKFFWDNKLNELGSYIC